jgi:hypothetical protein
MTRKRRIWLIAGFLAMSAVIVIALGSLHLLPLNILSVQQKPEQAPQKVYDYYIIIDEQDGKTLMYVPLVVSVGDELISEENKYYKIVKIEDNRAYARFVKDVNLEKYAPPAGQSGEQQNP